MLSTLQRFNVFSVLTHPVQRRCKTLQQQTSQQIQSRTLYFVPKSLGKTKKWFCTKEIDCNREAAQIMMFHTVLSWKMHLRLLPCMMYLQAQRTSTVKPLGRRTEMSFSLYILPMKLTDQMICHLYENMNVFQFLCHLLNWMEHSTQETSQFCRRNQLTRVDWTSWNFILSCYWWASTNSCSGDRSSLTVQCIDLWRCSRYVRQHCVEGWL